MSGSPADNLLALQAQVAASTRGKLAPILGATSPVKTEAARPKNEEAYDLYLRNIPLHNDPESNREALTMLQRSVQLDPDYAPAWFALSGRAYANARLSGGGEPMMRLSDEAAERALAMLGRAIDGGYCAVPAMDTDPFFSGVRGLPEFAEARRKGEGCQAKFLSERSAKP